VINPVLSSISTFVPFSIAMSLPTRLSGLFIVSSSNIITPPMVC
jgi:hypothetical protein